MDSAVVVLNDFCHVQGGASKVAIDEAIALARAGLEVIFLGAVGPPAAELAGAPLTVVCLDQSELIDVARHPTVMIQGLWNAAAGRRAREILSRLSPLNTVVHLHGYTKALTTSPVRQAKLLGFPIICTLHDFFSACPNGAFFDYPAMTPCRRRALSARCLAAHCDKRHYTHKLYRYARATIQRRFGHLPDGVRDYIALSEYSERLLKPYLPPHAQFHRLPNMVDIPPAPPVRVARNRLILYVGRLDLEKGVRLLGNVVERLGLECVMVGDGPLRQELAAIPGVTVTGWVAHDAVRQYLARARCIVFPSLWYETFGLVTAEAAASGVPAIVSDTCAAAERIDDGRTGWRFRGGDADGLVRCLQLLDDDELVGRVGAAAYRAHWAAQAAPEDHTRRLIEIYRGMLRERAATSPRSETGTPSERTIEANFSSRGE